MSAARRPGGLIRAPTATTPALALTLVAAPARAEERRGPDPTTESISATAGPFAVTSTWLRGSFQFGDAQVFHPTSAADGPFGVVVICPGFVSRWFQMAWLGPRLASQVTEPRLIIGAQADAIAPALVHARPSSPAGPRTCSPSGTAAQGRIAAEAVTGGSRPRR